MHYPQPIVRDYWNTQLFGTYQGYLTLTTGDIDNNGYPDVVVPANPIQIFLNNGEFAIETRYVFFF